MCLAKGFEDKNKRVLATRFGYFSKGISTDYKHLKALVAFYRHYMCLAKTLTEKSMCIKIECIIKSTCVVHSEFLCQHWMDG